MTAVRVKLFAKPNSSARNKARPPPPPARDGDPDDDDATKTLLDEFDRNTDGMIPLDAFLDAMLAAPGPV